MWLISTYKTKIKINKARLKAKKNLKALDIKWSMKILRSVGATSACVAIPVVDQICKLV
jgi:hypothetical protein